MAHTNAPVAVVWVRDLHGCSRTESVKLPYDIIGH